MQRCDIPAERACDYFSFPLLGEFPFLLLCATGTFPNEL